MSIRTKVVAAAATAAALGAVVAGAAPASASSGGCVWGVDACLFFHSGVNGAYYGDGGNDNYGYPNWDRFGGCYGNCDGGNVLVKNNAASVWNMNPNTVRIFYYSNQNYNGPFQDIPGQSSADLNSQLKNNNASQAFV